MAQWPPHTFGGATLPVGQRWKQLGMSSPGHIAALDQWSKADRAGVDAALRATGVNESGVKMSFAIVPAGG